jgi:uncharacterized protein (DUF1786 family)
MMSRLIILFTLSYTLLFGYEYDRLLLRAQSNIFPKLLLLDKHLAKKVSDNEIVFCIVHHPSDRIKSEKIKDMLKEKFGQKLEKYKFKVILKEFDDVKEDDKVNAYYILQGSYEKVEKISNIAKKNKIPTFSYDPLYFKEDVLISMTIQNSSTIYLNKKILKQYDIDFIDIFYQTVRFVDE